MLDENGQVVLLSVFFFISEDLSIDSNNYFLSSVTGKSTILHNVTSDGNH